MISLSPISYQLIQLRLADALLPLVMIFGWPAVIGLTVGCFVANVFGGLGIIDLIGGSFANFLAGVLAWRIGLQKFKGTWIFGIGIQILVIAVIVGSYLSIFFSVPLLIGVVGLLASNMVTIGVVGYLLLRILNKIPFFERFNISR